MCIYMCIYRYHNVHVYTRKPGIACWLHAAACAFVPLAAAWNLHATPLQLTFVYIFFLLYIYIYVLSHWFRASAPRPDMYLFLPGCDPIGEGRGNMDICIIVAKWHNVADPI